MVRYGTQLRVYSKELFTEKQTDFTEDFKEQKHDAYKCKTKGRSESIKGTDKTSMTRKRIFCVPVVPRKQTNKVIHKS